MSDQQSSPTKDFCAYVEALEARITALEAKPSPTTPAFGRKVVTNQQERVELGWVPSQVFLYHPDTRGKVGWVKANGGFNITVEPDTPGGSILWAAWR